MENSGSCLVAQGTTISGDLKVTENTRMDGRITGNLSCGKKLVLGTNARVEGNVEAAEGVVMGEILGNIRVQGTLQLAATARIEGDIIADVLVVEIGAQCDGRCVVRGKSGSSRAGS